jgi:hypothetical protein
MDPRERQLHLRLDALHLDDPQPRGLPRGVAQERGLPDARVAANHEHRAVTVTCLSECGVEAFALTRPADEP